MTPNPFQTKGPYSPPHRIELNTEQSHHLSKALLATPRPPTPAMQEAMRAYRATVKSDLD